MKCLSTSQSSSTGRLQIFNLSVLNWHTGEQGPIPPNCSPCGLMFTTLRAPSSSTHHSHTCVTAGTIGKAHALEPTDLGSIPGLLLTTCVLWGNLSRLDHSPKDWCKINYMIHGKRPNRSWLAFSLLNIGEPRFTEKATIWHVTPRTWLMS